MDDLAERRRERRLRYQWPVWFAEDFSEMLTQGQMVDVCSSGAAFTCSGNESCPWPGQHITARFSVPRFRAQAEFDIADFIRNGYVCRVDRLDAGQRRIAIRFFEALPFKPGEQPNMQLDYIPLGESASA
jgi:hypothetical protein